MNIIELIVRFCKFFPGITSGFLHYGLVLVYFYHLFCSSALLNTTFEKAHGIEWAANTALAPVQYLCNGKSISYDEKAEKFIISERYHYETDKMFYSPIAFTLLPPSLIIGGTLKAIAHLSPEVRTRHSAFKKQMHSLDVISNNEKFRSMKIEVNDWKKGERLISQGYTRRPGDENILSADKEALSEIAQILTKRKIPFWVDCGTCIGTYRYAGVIPWDNDIDISILQPDFQNSKNALNALDPEKFVVQDWSGRGDPGTYIRIYVKESHNHIDIYTNSINLETNTIKYNIAHLDSSFMSEKWKQRETLQANPIPFDVIFPLKLGLFDGIEVPVPNKVVEFLTIKYGPDLNPPRIYSEETGNYEKDLSHPYWHVPLAN